MKRRTLITVGVLFVLVGLAAGWHRHTTRPQEITVHFEGFTNSSDQGWTAVFRLTNGTPNTVFYAPSLRRESGALLRGNRSLSVTKILAPHIGQTWIHPVPDTNSVFRLQAECWEQTSPWVYQVNDLIRWFNEKCPRFRVPLRHRHEYVLTCPTEKRWEERKLERP